jgi:hypothetical protein
MSDARTVIALKVSKHAECENCIIEEKTCAICEREADAILAALAEAGLVIVPKADADALETLKRAVREGSE